MRYANFFRAAAVAAALLPAVAAAPAFAQSTAPQQQQTAMQPLGYAPQAPVGDMTSGEAVLHGNSFPGAVTDSTGVTHYGVNTTTEAYRLGAM